MSKEKILKEPKFPIPFFTIGIKKEKDYFIGNLGMLVTGGMTIPEAIDSTKEEVKSGAMKKILTKIRFDLDNGVPLWRSLQNSRVFSGNIISLIRVGEESGRLSQNLKLISTQLEKENTFKSKIRSAMMYPVLVLSVTLVVGIGIAWFVLPKLAIVFSELKLKLPFITKALISTGVYLGENGTRVLPVFIGVLVFFVYFIFYFPKTKFIGQSLFFSFPGIKNLLKEVEIARFGYLMGTLLEAGIPVTRAFESLHNATSFPKYKKMYKFLGESMDEGNSFQKSFTNYKKSRKLIPTSIQQLVIAGERSGNLPEVLLKISDMYETKTENTMKNISVVLEPVLLVVVWLGVVGVALAVILPIYNLIGGLNSGFDNPAPPVAQEASTAVDTPVVSDLALPEITVLETGLGYLNVRSEPSTQGEIVGKINPGGSYTYTEVTDDWYKIDLDGVSGWVYGKYVQRIEKEKTQ